MSDEEIPRRLRRFHRDEPPTQEEVHDRSTEIAIKEVDKFKDKHARYPQKEELDEISESVFTQLKNELKQDKNEQKEISSQINFGNSENELENLETDPDTGMKKMSFLEKRKARRHHGHKEVKQPEKETKTAIMSKQEKQKVKMPEINDANEIPDLLEKNDDLSKLESSAEVKKLSSVEELGSLENQLEDVDDFDLIEKETETTENNCPTCNNKTKEFIYCPNCGEAFCDHCAKKIDVLTDSLGYTCPKCSHEFKKRKNIN